MQVLSLRKCRTLTRYAAYCFFIATGAYLFHNYSGSDDNSTNQAIWEAQRTRYQKYITTFPLTKNRQIVEKETVPVIKSNFSADVKPTENDILEQNRPAVTEKKQQPTALVQNEYKKVLLFGYTRGGTTFCSELFNRNPDAMFWYEPVDGFYWDNYGIGRWHVPMHVFFDIFASKEPYIRNYTKWETMRLVELNHNLLNCNFRKLPSSVLWHTHSPPEKMQKLLSFKECAWTLRDKNFDLPANCQGEKRIFAFCKNYVAYAMRKRCPEIIANITNQLKKRHSVDLKPFNLKKGMETFFKNFVICREMAKTKVLNACGRLVEGVCSNSKIIAYKALRLSMKTIRHMLKKESDMYVLYLVRDPRAIVHSRLNLNLKTRWSKNVSMDLTEATLICTKMMHDLVMYSKLKQRFSNRIFLVKYEELALNFNKTVRSIYQNINASVPQEVFDWSKEKISENGDWHSTNRVDWSASIARFKHNFPASFLRNVNLICSQVLKDLKYDL